MTAAPDRSFSEALHSNGPASEWAREAHLYSWLVGDWDMDVVIYRSDGSKQRAQRGVSAGLVLEGRAIEDIRGQRDGQFGARPYGSVPASRPQATICWSFTDITPDSFHWRGERSVYGASWQLQREYFARRVG